MNDLLDPGLKSQRFGVSNRPPRPHFRVGDWMSSPVTVVHPEAHVLDAFDLMMEKEIHRLPVVDADGHLVGIVAMVDIQAVHPSRITRLPPDAPNLALESLTVGQIMTSNPVTATPETSVAQAASIMLHRKIHSLPVVNLWGQVVGIITESDLFRLLSRQTC